MWNTTTRPVGCMTSSTSTLNPTASNTISAISTRLFTAADPTTVDVHSLQDVKHTAAFLRKEVAQRIESGAGGQADRRAAGERDLEKSHTVGVASAGDNPLAVRRPARGTLGVNGTCERL